MLWDGDLERFERWCVEAIDLTAFAAALGSVPAAAWPSVRERLDAALGQPGPGEPSATNLQVGVGLVARMRTPAMLLRQQVRLEKLRLVAEHVPAGRSAP